MFAKTRRHVTGPLLLALTAATTPALADWELENDRSVVNFLSVKNAKVAELHHFKSVTGSISDAGEAQLVIDLDSVETLVPIRNQRMRELLFETVRFPSATLSASVPEALLTLDPGESTTDRIDMNLQLHGQSKVYPANVVVTHTADGALQVSLREPLLVQAADFGLAGGVQVLREVAGLQSISTAVPVSAHLVFSNSED